MAELKPLQPDQGLSLSRWSRLKRSGGEAVAVPTPNAVTPVEALDAGGESATTELELPPISAISLAEDFTPFMQSKVPQALKQQALKALFKEPHFNVMDGLDTYIDDYTVFEPITPEVMATLSSWKTIMNPPQQVVTKGGYAVDVESDEGRAVLAAHAQAEIEALSAPEASIATADDDSERPLEASAEKLSALATVHPRHGRRVGEFTPTETMNNAPLDAPAPDAAEPPPLPEKDA